MKKLIACLAVAVTLSVSASAGTRRNPTNRDGKAFMDLMSAGADYVYHTGTTATQVCTGRCLLLGIIRETGAVASTVLLRNTITADNTYVANALPIIHFQPDTGAHDSVLPFSVVFSSGISVDASAAGQGVTVLYIDLDL